MDLREYLVRGAVLICTNGSHKRKINLPKCHGIYAGIHPLLHELEYLTESACGREKCNITHFGVCCPAEGSPPPTETITYTKTRENSKDGIEGKVTGCKCEPVIIGRWKNTHILTKIVDNGDKNPSDRQLATCAVAVRGPLGQSALTMNSFLVCKYGGMITPVTSGQHNNPISPDDFYSISDYFDIRSHGANNNPPTGAGDAGFTFNNEFNALSAVSVLCGSKFVQYKPFQDEPEEDAFSVGELAFKTVLGLAAVGGLAIYAASLVMSAGATAPAAPYVLAGLVTFCGGAEVLSLAEKDYARQDVSSIMDYTTSVLKGVDIGLLAGAGYCVAPEVAAGVAASYIPPGIEVVPIAGMFIKSEELVNIAVVAASTATFSNVLTTISESAEVLTGRNRMEEVFGSEGDEALKNTAQAATSGILAEAFFNPQYLDKSGSGDAGNIRQNAMYDNGEGGTSAKGLLGHNFEDYLTENIGGEGSFSVGGRDFDGGVGNRWWEAKSGNYWNMLEEKPNELAKFKSDMGARLKIATENGASYELFSNTPIPESIKEWLTKKGIPFTEIFE